MAMKGVVQERVVPGDSFFFDPFRDRVWNAMPNFFSGPFTGLCPKGPAPTLWVGVIGSISLTIACFSMLTGGARGLSRLTAQPR